MSKCPLRLSQKLTLTLMKGGGRRATTTRTGDLKAIFVRKHWQLYDGRFLSWISDGKMTTLSRLKYDRDEHRDGSQRKE
jgi:hypothetical protein